MAAMQNVKCVVVGDGAVGKTRCAMNGFFDNVVKIGWLIIGRDTQSVNLLHREPFPCGLRSYGVRQLHHQC